ncbi:alpha/beta fold hydrolase [Kribbella catacumbae]|uniref:alpha/beta fold hydrolase n=1 Tax=Kribbella catacumbae TaxID=460086 RepID=UPI00037EC75B|nr:alpha/beta fold hydrolase [Kribbella catacumbae]
MLDLTATRLAGTSGDLLVVGPSLGTSVEALWGRCSRLLGHRFEVVGWDLPGHGRSRPAAVFGVSDLADGVRGIASRLADGRRAWYAGDSLGGAVGLALAVDPGPFAGVVVIAGAARIGEAWAWRERAELVRSAGTAVMVAGSAVRWFAPGFVDREPEVAAALLDALADTDTTSYAGACDALAGFDLRSRLGETSVPVLVAAGEYDDVVTPALADLTAEAIPDVRRHLFRGCGHLPPAEDPVAVAEVLTVFLADLVARQEATR